MLSSNLTITSPFDNIKTNILPDLPDHMDVSLQENLNAHIYLATGWVTSLSSRMLLRSADGF